MEDTNQAAVLIELDQGLIPLLQLRPVGQKLVVLGGIGGILQGEEHRGGIDLAVELGADLADGTGVARDFQRTVYVRHWHNWIIKR